jgi:hypothetical protein
MLDDVRVEAIELVHIRRTRACGRTMFRVLGERACCPSQTRIAEINRRNTRVEATV